MFPKVNQKQSFPALEEVFDGWNKKKKEIATGEQDLELYFGEGEVWWVTLGQNIGQESFGKGENFRRPILVLKKLSNDSCICIPLSSKIKIGTWFCSTMLDGLERTALLYQIKMIDKRRFQRKIGELPENDFGEIKKRLKELLNL